MEGKTKENNGKTWLVIALLVAIMMISIDHIKPIIVLKIVCGLIITHMIYAFVISIKGEKKC